MDIAFVAEWIQNIDVMWERRAIAEFLRGLASLGRLICFDTRGHGVADDVPNGRTPTSSKSLTTPGSFSTRSTPA
jgi:hypothetical protein